MRQISKTLTTVIALTALAGSSLMANAQIRVELNGDPVRFYGTQPREVGGRVMVPLRGVLEKMGATVDWDAGTQTVHAAKGDMDLELPIGSRTAHINNRAVRLDVPAMTMAGSTMVPLRFVSEALGADVAWSGQRQTVMINTDGRIARNDREYYRGRERNDDTANRTDRRYRKAAFLPAGTIVPVTLDEALKSDESTEGDRFTATIQAGRDDAGLPAGTKFEGYVTEALEAKGGKPGVLAVNFRRIIFPDGTQKTIDGRVVSLDSKNLSRDSDGRLVAKSGSKGDEQLKWIGIGAGAGLLISTLTKGNVLVNTVLGAGAGYLYNQLQRKGASDVNLKSGSELGIKLDRRLDYSAERG